MPATRKASLPLTLSVITAISALALPGLSATQTTAKKAAPKTGKPTTAAQTKQPTERLSLTQIKAWELVNDGYQLYKKESYPEAIKLFTAALAADPGCTDAQLLLAETYEKMGQTQAATDQYLKILAHGKNAQAISGLATIKQSEGKLAEALALFTDIQRLYPKSEYAANALIMQKALAPVLKSEQDAIKYRAKDNKEDDYFAYATSGSVAKWTTDKFPLRVYIPTDEQASKIPYYCKEFGELLNSAFQEWSTKTNNAVRFEFVSDPKKAEIVCAWANNPKYLHSQAELGEAQVNHGVEGLIHANIIFLTYDIHAKHVLSSDEIKGVCLHEIGHALGIGGHSTDPHDVMFHTSTAVASLTDRDSRTMLHLYRRTVENVACTLSSHSDDPISLNIYGCQLMAAQKFTDAIAAFKNVLRLNPKFEGARDNMVHCFNNLGFNSMVVSDYNLAEFQLSQALKIMHAATDCNKTLKEAVYTNYIITLKKLDRVDEAADIQNRMAAELGKTSAETPVCLLTAAPERPRRHTTTAAAKTDDNKPSWWKSDDFNTATGSKDAPSWMTP